MGFVDLVNQWIEERGSSGIQLERIEFALPRSRKRVRRPRAYSVEEVHQLLEHGFPSPKYRTFFMTLYGGGLRLSEGCHLKVEDIDPKRMLIRVEQGKGMNYAKVVVMQSTSRGKLKTQRFR